VDDSRALQQPIVTGAEVVRSRLDSTRKMECVERFDASLIERLRPLLDLLGYPDNLNRLGEHLLGMRLAQGVGITLGFVRQGIGRE
jgi:hypothetical protein